MANTITISDGTTIYYKDWGSECGQPLVVNCGWPFDADVFEDQMSFLATHAYRCIRDDRRGHGRSSQPWEGNDPDTYADDLAVLLEELELDDLILVGHAAGGEVVRHIGGQGNGRVSKPVLISAIVPLMPTTDANPEGKPIEAFDELRKAVLRDRAQFFKDLSMPFHGYNRDPSKVSEGLCEAFWPQGMMPSRPGCHYSIKAFPETDLTEDLKAIDVPALITHRDDDRIAPIKAWALLAFRITKNAQLIVYEGGSHGIYTAEKKRVCADLEVFTGVCEGRTS